MRLQKLFVLITTKPNQTYNTPKDVVSSTSTERYEVF